MKPHEKRPNADVNAKGEMLVRPWEKILERLYNIQDVRKSQGKFRSIQNRFHMILKGYCREGFHPILLDLLIDLLRDFADVADEDSAIAFQAFEGDGIGKL